MVIKPHDVVARVATKSVAGFTLTQPGIKCRGREYLRIIYGAEYTSPGQLDRLRQRAVGHKRALAIREFSLGIEALERFIDAEPLYRVHECVFGVLALESEPVDPAAPARETGSDDRGSEEYRGGSGGGYGRGRLRLSLSGCSASGQQTGSSRRIAGALRPQALVWIDEGGGCAWGLDHRTDRHRDHGVGFVVAVVSETSVQSRWCNKRSYPLR